MRRIAMQAGLGLLLGVWAGVAWACGDGDGENPTATAVPSATAAAGEAEFLRADVPRNAADEGAIAATSAAMDAFGFDLYRILAREEGNVAMSPYSAVVALAMTRHGAAGETREQMEAVLHTDVAGDLDAGLNAIALELDERPGTYPLGDITAELELSTANQLFGQRDFPFEDAFLEKLAADYGAGMALVDYATATEEARATINRWVAEQTRERIPELIPPGILDDLTRLVLTNAIYLKAPWVYRFDPAETAPGDFHRLDGSTVEAEMMHLSTRLFYTEDPGYQAVLMPYVDGSLGMLVIVPEEGRFAEVEASIDGETLAAIVGGLETYEVTLALPKFEFRTQAKLKEALIEMGMPIPFDHLQADFLPMSPAGQDLYIVEVLQEVFIAVDENGTEAAAATAVVMGDQSLPPPATVTADRPFLFLIRDMETGATLFMGRVADPAAED